jgi:hypothetical protein
VATGNVSSLAAATGNVLTLTSLNTTAATGNIFSLSSLAANVATGNVSSLAAATGNVLTLTFLNATAATGNIFSLSSLAANVATGNVISLAALTANVQTLNVSSQGTVGNLSVVSNIIPVTNGNTYVQGNVVVSGNVYSSLGQLGAGGSLFFSLGATYSPSTYTGSVPYAGTTTYALRLTPFTKQGSSTYISVSANGCFQFSQTGVYTICGTFLTDNNNVLGMGIGSNVIDYGTRTDQSYLYSRVPMISQNPTDVLETQIYVSSTSLYYYIDLFAVDGVVLQPTASTLGGTWISAAPLGGVAAGSSTVTLGTLGNIVTGQSGSYGALVADYYIGMVNGGTVTLPLGSSVTAGKTYVIKDESGLAGTFVAKRVTIAATSPNLVDGQSTAVLALNYGSLSIMWTGAAWSIF